MQWIARLSRTHFLIAFVALLAFISTFTYLQSLDKKIAVAQLAHDIDSGQTITTKDIEFINVSHDKKLSTQLISKNDFKNKKLIARTNLSSSDLLTKTNTVRQASEHGLQSLSIGIDIDRANGGDIRKGDTVNIWRTGNENGLVAKAITVRNILQPNKRLGVSTTKTITIVVEVTSTQAENLAQVIGSKDIMIVLTNGTQNDSLSESQSIIQSGTGFQPLDLSPDEGPGV